MKFRVLNLRQKIFLGYITLILVITVVGVWSIINFVQLNHVLMRVTRENYVSVLAVENMVGAIERQDSSMLLFLLGETEESRTIYSDGKKIFLHWLDTEEKNITLPGERELVDNLKNAYSSYISTYEVFSNRITEKKYDEAQNFYTSSIEPLFRAIRDNLQHLLEMNHQALLEGNSSSQLTSRRATFSTIGVVSIAVIFALLFGMKTSQSIVHPTRLLTKVIRNFDTESLDEVRKIRSQDEIGELAKEFYEMIIRIQAYEKVLNRKVFMEQRKALKILNGIEDGMIVTNPCWQIEMLNPAIEEILEKNRNEIIGNNIIRLIPELSGFLEKFQTPSHEENTPGYYTLLLKQGNRERYYDVEVEPLLLEDGEQVTNANGSPHPSGFIVFLKDISRFKKLEKMKSDFLSDVSHEIRTPLTSIMLGIGMLEEIKQIQNNKEGIDLVKTVKEETEKLIYLVDDLLELSRFESGKVELNREKISLKRILDKVISSLQPKLQVKYLNIQILIPENLPLVEVDAKKIASVLTNLIDNAIRYSESGQSIGVEVETEGDWIKVGIKDSGPGIPREYRELVFDKFFQLKERPGGKVGLGLSICKSIVENHGGKIWVEGGAEKGSKFVFTLPFSSV